MMVGVGDQAGADAAHDTRATDPSHYAEFPQEDHPPDERQRHQKKKIATQLGQNLTVAKGSRRAADPNTIAKTGRRLAAAPVRAQ